MNTKTSLLMLSSFTIGIIVTSITFVYATTYTADKIVSVSGKTSNNSDSFSFEQFKNEVEEASKKPITVTLDSEKEVVRCVFKLIGQIPAGKQNDNGEACRELLKNHEITANTTGDNNGNPIDLLNSSINDNQNTMIVTNEEEKYVTRCILGKIQTRMPGANKILDLFINSACKKQMAKYGLHFEYPETINL